MADKADANKQVVIDFVDAWNNVDWVRIAGLMTEDITYHNVPWEPVRGRDAVMSNLAGFAVEQSDWINHHIVAEGDIVMTERTDRLQMNGVWKTLRVMGVFVLRNGAIAEWRDYFDPAELNVDIPKPQKGVLSDFEARHMS